MKVGYRTAKKDVKHPHRNEMLLNAGERYLTHYKIKDGMICVFTRYWFLVGKDAFEDELTRNT